MKTLIIPECHLELFEESSLCLQLLNWRIDHFKTPTQITKYANLKFVTVFGAKLRALSFIEFWAYPPSSGLVCVCSCLCYRFWIEAVE